MMIDAKAIISVPFFNEAQFLEETLECLKAVPRDVPVKFFLCDNKSTDGSSEIAAKFAKEDTRFIHHIQEENLGATGNFKFAFENSKSDYFMWLGAHDIITPSYVAAAIEAFEKNPDISYAAAEPFGFISSIKESILLEPAIYNKFHEENFSRYLQSIAVLGNCTIVNSMFRRAYAKGYGWQHTISWDHVFISRMLWHGPIHYTMGHRYYRRNFEDDPEARQAKLLGASQVKKALPRWEFFDFYVTDFQSLYEGPESLKNYLSFKILEILEKRFGFKSFDTRDPI